MESVMNAITIIDNNFNSAMSWDEFYQIGQSLAAQDRNLKWQVGDWVAFGKAHYGEQMDLALAELTDDPKALIAAAKVAERFPAHIREPSLSYKHYASLADMAQDDVDKLVAMAKEHRLSAKALQNEVNKRKVETGQILLLADDDQDTIELTALARAWNRAQKNIKQDFLEMANEANLGIIEI